jgi:S-(hydroxymethyl)glutathione dehydrogenase/alcohol dehydrogenase
LKAAVCYEYPKFVIEEVDIDPPEKDGVKVRVAAAAICHSDLHQVRGEHGGELPAIGGHEVAGIIEEVGEDVTSVKPGDHVVASSQTSGCGRCINCTLGLHHMCTNRRFVKNRHHNKKGQSIGAMGGRVAGFAEYTTLAETQVVKIPDEMPLDRASLLACGVITGFGAVVNRAQVKPHSSVVVVGCGGVGLNAIQGAVFCGGHPVIAVDVLDNKLEAARVFGATHTVNSAKVEDPIKAVQELTSGRGADYVILTAAGGGTELNRQSFLMSGPRGMMVMVGMTGGELGINRMHFGAERMLTSSTMGSIGLGIFIPRLVSLYQAGRLKLDELITGRISLEQINEGMDALERGEALRTIIMF